MRPFPITYFRHVITVPSNVLLVFEKFVAQVVLPETEAEDLLAVGRIFDALIRLDQAAELVEFRASPATEPLYTINPFAEEGLAGLFVTHPPVGERVRRLRALDPNWREKLRAA